MCESTVWLHHPDGRTEKIAENVLFVTQSGPIVVLRGVLGEPRQVPGTIREIDSFKHTITVQAAETSNANGSDTNTGEQTTRPDAQRQP